jgi:hypothetical protein
MTVDGRPVLGVGDAPTGAVSRSFLRQRSVLMQLLSVLRMLLYAAWYWVQHLDPWKICA